MWTTFQAKFQLNSYTDLVRFRVIWNGNGIMWFEHGTARNLVERYEMGTPHRFHLLHLLTHHLVHCRQSAVLGGVVTTPTAAQSHQQQSPTHQCKVWYSVYVFMHCCPLQCPTHHQCTRGIVCINVVQLSEPW